MNNSKIYLYSPNDPIIESSNDLVLAPYNFKYEQLLAHAEAANIMGQFTDDDGEVQDKVNHWNQVHDFTPKEEGGLNYELIDPTEFATVQPKDIKEDIEIEEGEFIFELPIDFGGTLSNETKGHKDSLMAFDIKTGAAEAQAAYEAKGKPESFGEYGGCFFGAMKVQKAPEAGTGVETEDVEISKMDWEDKRYVPSPTEGFRFVYIDELLANEDLKAKVEEFLDEWAIVQLINGWTEGSGYGGKVIKTNEDHQELGEILLVSANYPI